MKPPARRTAVARNKLRTKIIVWGTVDDGKQRRSFQCDFGTKMTGFKLRPIAAKP